jgi:NADH-quinone oxidoreductase subunit B
MHYRMALVLKRVDDQMCEHTWVVAFGACAASGGFSRRDATMQGIDRGIPVDVLHGRLPSVPQGGAGGIDTVATKGRYRR